MSDHARRLLIDTDRVRATIVDFISQRMADAGFQRAVVGLSGGVDSALPFAADYFSGQNAESSKNAH